MTFVGRIIDGFIFYVQSKSETYPKGQELAGHVGVSHLLWTQMLHGKIKWELTGGLLPKRVERKHQCSALGACAMRWTSTLAGDSQCGITWGWRPAQADPGLLSAFCLLCLFVSSPYLSFASLPIKLNNVLVCAPNLFTAPTIWAWAAGEMLCASASTSPTFLSLSESAGDMSPSHAEQEREQINQSLLSWDWLCILHLLAEI